MFLFFFFLSFPFTPLNTVAELLEGGLVLGLSVGLGDGVLVKLGKGDLAGVVGLGLDDPLGLKAANNILILPPELARKARKNSVPALGAEAEDAEGSGHNNALHLVVRRGDALN